MKSLAGQLASYESYHRHPINTFTHFFGVPLVAVALFVPLGWLRVPGTPVTGASVFLLALNLYYLRLDWKTALTQLPFAVALLVAADAASRLPFWESAGWFAATFVGGWAVQLAGHGIEGRRPAIADNFLQLFNAPLFLAAETAIFLGYRDDLRRAIEAARPHPPAPAPPHAPLHSTGGAASRGLLNRNTSTSPSTSRPW